jgi:hypothetical protein
MTRVTFPDDRSTAATSSTSQSASGGSLLGGLIGSGDGDAVDSLRDEAATALKVAGVAAGALGPRNVVRIGGLALRHPALVVALPAIVALTLLLLRERRRRLVIEHEVSASSPAV